MLEAKKEIVSVKSNGITTNATDGLGFFFDTSMTDDAWWISGVANDVDAVHQNTTFAPVIATLAIMLPCLPWKAGVGHRVRSSHTGSAISHGPGVCFVVMVRSS